MNKEFSKRISNKETKFLWINEGINVGTDDKIRCPHCNWILAEGEYSMRPQRFICPKCKEDSYFQRLEKN